MRACPPGAAATAQAVSCSGPDHPGTAISLLRSLAGTCQRRQAGAMPRLPRQSHGIPGPPWLPALLVLLCPAMSCQQGPQTGLPARSRTSLSSSAISTLASHSTGPKRKTQRGTRKEREREKERGRDGRVRRKGQGCEARDMLRVAEVRLHPVLHASSSQADGACNLNVTWTR